MFILKLKECKYDIVSPKEDTKKQFFQKNNNPFWFSSNLKKYFEQLDTWQRSTDKNINIKNKNKKSFFLEF